MTRSPILLVAAVMCLAALLSLPASAQVPAGKIIPGKSAPVLMIDRLAREADVVVAGRVSTTRGEWNEDRSRIQTRVTVVVDRTLKGGQPATGELTILVPGGEVDGVGELYTHMATFRENEEVLVFANRDAKGNLRVTSGMDGKLRIERDAKTGARTIPSLGDLEEVSARVSSALKPESTVPDKQ